MLDAEIDYAITVVRQNNVDQVLADVVHVALDGRQDHRAFGGGAAFLFHERLEKTHRGLHRFGGLQHKRKLHLAAAKQIADDFHAFEQNVVDDVERGVFFERGLQLIFEADLFAIDDVVLQTLFDGLAFRSLLGALRFHAFEERGEFDQRIVGADIAFEPALVIDQLARDFQLLFADTIQRLDLAGVDDRGIQAGFDGIVQEHRVENHA